MIRLLAFPSTALMQRFGVEDAARGGLIAPAWIGGDPSRLPEVVEAVREQE